MAYAEYIDHALKVFSILHIMLLDKQTRHKHEADSSDKKGMQKETKTKKVYLYFINWFSMRNTGLSMRPCQ